MQSITTPRRLPSLILWLATLGGLIVLAAVLGVTLRGGGDGTVPPASQESSNVGTTAVKPDTTQTTAPNYSARATCVGMPAPGIFMVFEGRRYRLAEIFCADGLSQSEVTAIGTTEQIDTEHQGTVTVYRDSYGSLFTLQPGQPSTGEGGTPATWNRWVPID